MSDKQQGKVAVENTLLRIQLDIVKELRQWKQEFLAEIGKNVLHVLELHGQGQMLGAQPELSDSEPDPSPPLPKQPNRPPPPIKKRKQAPSQSEDELTLTDKQIPKPVKLY